MNDNKLKLINGQLIRASLEAELQRLQKDNIISYCTSNYHNGYDGYDKRQFYAPFFIEFHNGEGWLLCTSNSIRSDRMNIHQWNSYHLKIIKPTITTSYLVIPDEVALNPKEKKNAENYQKSITGNKFSAIKDVCYQSEIIELIKNHNGQLEPLSRHQITHWDSYCYNDVAEEPSFESLIVGCYRNSEHLQWILSNSLYNIRINKRRGAVTQTYLVSKASKLLLYNQSNHKEYKFFNLSGKIERVGSDRMAALDYPNYHDGREYLLYHINNLLAHPIVNVDEIIEKYKSANWIQYAPIFISYNGRIEDLERLI